MNLQKMYPPHKDSPSTFLTGNISATDTLVTVGNAAVLPQTVPYPLTIGIDKAVTETVMVTAIGSGNNQLTITRAAGALAWESGVKCARVFNAADLKTVQDNVTNVVTQSNADNVSITALTPRVTAAEAAITANKTTAATATAAVATDLATEVTRAKGIEGGLETNKITRSELPQVITDWVYAANGTALTLTITRYNASSKATSNFTKTIPIVNDTNVGIMTPQAYKEITALRNDVNSLINQGGRFIGVSFANTAALNAYAIPESVKMGDYTYVLDDETHQKSVTRYVYDSEIGNNWGPAISNPFGATQINAFININGVTIAVGNSGKIARSTDNGFSWGPLITNPFGTSHINDIANADGTLIAVGTSGAIARSTDNGVTWGSLITNPFGSGYIQSIATVNGVAIAVAASGGIARSTDKGLTWGALITNPFGTDLITKIANANGVVIAGTSTGKIARSTDNGVTWGALITNPFGGSTIYSITDVNGVIIASGNSGKIARSTDNGVTWGSLITNPLGSSTIGTVNINGLVFAKSGSKMAKSTDKGLTWTELATNPLGSSAINSIANINGIAIAGGADGKIARSTAWYFTFVIDYDPVGIADSTTPGIVKSDAGTTDGKIFVETDATMSVIGWDKLDERFDGMVDRATGIAGGLISCPSASNGLVNITNMVGETVQVKTVAGGGKNKFPVIATQTKSGVTLTSSNDGTLTITGTLTGNVKIAFNILTNFKLTAGVAYAFSANNPVANTRVTVQLSSTDTGTISQGAFLVANSINATKSFTPTVNDSPVYATITVDPGTLTNFVLKPQLEIGPATTYEPYAQNSPTPEYPSALKYAKDFNLVSTGTNVFDISKASFNPSLGGLTNVINQDGSITVNGTINVANYLQIVYLKMSLPFGTYRVGGEATVDGVRHLYAQVALTMKDGTIKYTASGGTFVVNALVSSINFVVQTSNVVGLVFDNVTIAPYLLFGADQLPYSKYKGDSKAIPFSFMGFADGGKNGKKMINGVMNDVIEAEQKILDGRENLWALGGTQPTDETLIRFSYNEYVIKYGSKLLCDKFNSVPYTTNPLIIFEEVVFSHGSTNQINLVIKKSRLATADVNGLRTWLSTNPITVQYERATPTYTPIPDIILKSWEGLTNAFTTAEVPVTITGDFKSELWSRLYLQDTTSEKLVKYTGGEITTQAQLDSILNNMSVIDANWYRAILFVNAELSLSGGTWYVEGFRTSAGYEWQKASCYNISSVKVVSRVKFNSVWQPWRKELLTSDLINNDTTGGADKPVSAEVAKLLGMETDALKGSIAKYEPAINGNITVTVAALDTMMTQGNYAVYFVTGDQFGNGTLWSLKVNKIYYNESGVGYVQEMTKVYPNTGAMQRRVYYTASGWGPWRGSDGMSYLIGAHNLNTYINSGQYTIGVLDNITNAPTTGTFVVDNCGVYIRQTILNNSATTLYARMSLDTGVTWSAWNVLSNTNITSATVNASYGTLTNGGFIKEGRVVNVNIRLSLTTAIPAYTAFISGLPTALTGLVQLSAMGTGGGTVQGIYVDTDSVKTNAILPIGAYILSGTYIT